MRMSKIIVKKNQQRARQRSATKWKVKNTLAVHNEREPVNLFGQLEKYYPTPTKMEL